MLQLLVGALVGVGGIIAYTETKFANKEMTFRLIDQEANQRQVDIGRIERKIDVIYELLINKEGK
jgi:hypothetical protein